MATKQFSLQFTVTGGVPSAVTATGQNVPVDGTYTINSLTDNNGPKLQLASPVGTMEQHGNYGLGSGYAGD
jgi:hypothetical protein